MATDDVWADDIHDEHGEDFGPNAADLARDWETRRSRFWNDGYREGLEEGKVKFIKDGFFSGFAEGTDLGFRLGAARGMMQVLSHSAAPHTSTGDTATTKAAVLKQDLDAFSKTVISPNQDSEAIHEANSTGPAAPSSAVGRAEATDPPSFAQISEDCGVLLSKTRDALQTDGVCLLQSQSEIVTGEKKP
ncbi:uncharacterized protein LOC142357260 [Convolutriloba macropyga]|uniref:uncharacterized protein LOC142357260 n=1 Tax=Convolutriloba macropyga TaxID=536237 RepID=UPI003F51E08C